MISSNVQTITDDLAAISGLEHLRVEKDLFIIAPENTEEISRLLHYANQKDIAINPCGGGTKQRWGNRVQPSLILQMRRLNAVREHTWEDMTCAADAGCTWSSMQSALATHGQFVALDPLWPDRATVGGIAATNDSGSLRLKYGGLRDLIIGMTIVLADGTIARSGGKVVKNVAGYDLHKLMTGAFGTLGVITEITFRLHSIPKHTQSFTTSSTDAASLGQLLLKVLDSNLSTQSLQLRSNGEGFNLDVRLASLPSVIQNQANCLAELAQGLNLTVFGSESNVWSERQSLFDEEAAFVFKATMLPSDISRITAIVHSLGGTSVTQATGVMTGSIPITASDELPNLRQALEAIHGSFTVLHKPIETTRVASSTPIDTLPLMREIKNRFDPNRILNPGRFVGGI